MARKKNPNFRQMWIHAGGAGTASALVDIAEAVVQAGIVPSPRQVAVNFNGFPETISGQPDEVRRDLASAKDNEFFAGNINIAAQGNQPRVTVGYNFGNGQVNMNVDHADQHAVGRLRELVQRYLPDSSVASPAPDTTPSRFRKGVQVDNYRLIYRLGRGHSGEVWAADVVSPPQNVKLSPETRVALKLYFPHILGEHSQSLRIQREFSVAADLDHPYIVSIHDILISPSRAYAFIAMDLVDGEPLASRIPLGGMAERDVATLGLQLFEALRELHSMGAIHRDVKAANIMVTSASGNPISIKLLDLGIVSVVQEPSMTGSSVFLGSKHSAPLEQLMGRELDARADIYAAGSVLSHAFTGSPMYYAVGPEGAIVHRMLEAPELLDVSRYSEGSGQQLAEFVNRCIALDPSKRPFSAQHCVEELQKLLGDG